jgi:hypothetical protein
MQADGNGASPYAQRRWLLKTKVLVNQLKNVKPSFAPMTRSNDRERSLRKVVQLVHIIDLGEPVLE